MGEHPPLFPAQWRHLLDECRFLGAWWLHDLTAKLPAWQTLDPKGFAMPAEYYLHEVLHLALRALTTAPKRKQSQIEEALVRDICKLLHFQGQTCRPGRVLFGPTPKVPITRYHIPRRRKT